MNGNLRVLQAVYCLGRGGAERLAIEITNELNRRTGIEALLISFDKTVDYEYPVEEVNYRFCPSEVNLSFTGKNKIQHDNYIEIVKEFKPDIIHSHLHKSEVVTRERIFPGIKYYSHVHAINPFLRNFSLKTLSSKKNLTNFYEKLWLKSRYKKCRNQFIAISEDCYKYAISTLDISPTDIIVIHNAVNRNKFNTSAHDSVDSLELITIGNLGVNKGHDFLLRVVKDLHDRGMKVNLTILGQDPDNGINLNRLIDLVHSLDLSQYVDFKGNVPDPERYLKKAYLYIHGAHQEGFGLALLEAMATGLPVVTTDAGGNAAIMENAKNGFIIKKRDVKEFSDNVEILIKNKQLYNQMSSYANMFSAQFSIEKYVDELLNFYGS